MSPLNAALYFKVKVLRINNTFCGDEPTWANACVGNNGNPSYVEYSKGFSQAANVLIDLVLSNHGIDYPVDDLIYPVCFNMRHSIELRLKGAVEELIKLSQIQKRTLQFDLSGSHDIGNIWKFFKEKSEKLDIRYVDINTRLEPTILDVAEIDSTGQTFRYPVDTESQKHLTDVSTINFLRLKQRFNELEKNLDSLHFLNTYLLEEYDLDSFTTKMSRAKLFNLANDLPNKSTWREESFRGIKVDLRNKYSLSSNDLTKSINLILSHYEMAPMVGEIISLKSLGFEELCLLLDEWIKINPEIKTRHLNEHKFVSISSSNIEEMVKVFEKAQQRRAAKDEVWEELSPMITPKVLAGFKALFYFARYKKFSEYYEIQYENELKEASSYFYSDKETFKKSFFHLYDKANLVDNFVISLLFLNHQEIADKLITRYGLDNAFSWLEEARSRELFMLPDICGYNKI